MCRECKKKKQIFSLFHDSTSVNLTKYLPFVIYREENILFSRCKKESRKKKKEKEKYIISSCPFFSLVKYGHVTNLSATFVSCNILSFISQYFQHRESESTRKKCSSTSRPPFPESSSRIDQKIIIPRSVNSYFIKARTKLVY